MARWKTAEELSQDYLVGSARLLAYSRRGNLPMLRGDDGAEQFDEEIVAQLFRRRETPDAASLGNLGVVGEARLGNSTLPPAPSVRDARAHAARLSGFQVEGALTAAERARRTGT
jgi:hypothetical protein